MKLRRCEESDVDKETSGVELVKTNYVGAFRTFHVEDAPSSRAGRFFHNSRIPLARLTDGLSKTLVIAERSSKLGTPRGLE